MQPYADFMGQLERIKIMAFNSSNVYQVEERTITEPEFGVEIILIIRLNDLDDTNIKMSSEGLYMTHSIEEIEELLK